MLLFPVICRQLKPSIFFIKKLIYKIKVYIQRRPMKPKIEEKTKISFNSQPHLTHISPSQGSPQEYLNLNAQKLRSRYVDINLQSFMFIKSGQIEKSIQILDIAQKQLQQCLRNNKKIDQIIITATLHNLASSYQKVGNSSKALDKIRVLLHNLNNFMPKLQENQFQSRMSSLYFTGMTARYYVFFLALTIQLNMVQASTIPANRVLQFYKKFFHEYRKSQLTITLINKRMTDDLISDMEQIDTLLSSQSCQQIMEKIKETLIKISSQNHQKTNIKIKKLSTQYLTTIFPLQLNVTETGVTEKNSRGKIFQNGLIQFALSLFLIGRSTYQSCKKYNLKQQSNQKISSLDKSKKCILWSIYFSFQLCTYYTSFHKQIINYFEQNFQNKQQIQKKKLKVIDSLQAPQLKVFGLWPQIKVIIQNIQSQKEKQLNKVQSLKDLLQNQQNSYNLLFSQKKKTNGQKSSMKQSIGSRRSKGQNIKQLMKSEKKIYEPRSQKKLSKQKDLNIKNSPKKDKSNTQKNEKKTTKVNSKSKQKKIIEKKKPKKNSFTHSLSNQKNSIKKFQNISKSRQKQKLDLSIPINDYFPVNNKKIRAAHDYENMSNSKQKKKYMTRQIFSLQKKIKQGSKTLYKKQRELFKSLKHL